MSTVQFSVVDVFSTTPYKGNPLAVVDDLSSSLTDTQMKHIARQFNLSETTFVSLPTVKNAVYRLRSFLPDGKEVFGAGHNSLGAIWWLAKKGSLGSIKPSGADNRIHFNQQLGPDALPVVVYQDPGDDNQGLSVTLRQAPPKFHGIHPNLAELAGVLGISEASIGFKWEGKTIATPQVVSTSTTRHLLVPISDETVLHNINLVDRDKLAKEIQYADNMAYGLYLFTPSSQNASAADGLPIFHARFFSPGMSGEDPATGSAAGPMAAYLYKYGIFELGAMASQEEQKVVVLQGLRAGRACYLTIAVGLLEGKSVQGIDDREAVSTSVTGQGVEVMKGSLVIPGTEMKF
ncbi:uncharacterized protein GIQ15_05320 [Arthroderma uncinatum]|uniref:uncharacterized protein n=1 Tax=Arthroderma uncinatum TaxID=74035 RepID=UPI00144A7C67|nr:uncharacterized protein GIQ15_05320 [Arthroderma uncinatum]KAF3482561.1 hypothetical protein GIQ15_05320 [Arthroderma uncinatum]